MDIATLQKTLDGIVAEYVARLKLRVEAIGDEGVTLSLPVQPEMVHAGGVMCGGASKSNSSHGASAFASRLVSAGITKRASMKRRIEV